MSSELIRSGFVFLALTFFTFWGIYSDNLVIARLLGASAVTEYAVVQRLSLVGHLFWALIIPLWPAYGEAIARGDYSWVQKTFERSLLVSFIIGLAVGIGLALFGSAIIRVWVGPEVHITPGLLYGFAFYIMLSGVIGGVSVVLNSGSFVRMQIWVLGPAALVSLGLKIMLCSRYGISGVIWATGIAYSLLYVLPGLWMIREFTRSTVEENGRRSV